MHKSKGSKHTLIVDRQKAKEFLAKRRERKEQRDGVKVHITERTMEQNDV